MSHCSILSDRANRRRDKPLIPAKPWSCWTTLGGQSSEKSSQRVRILFAGGAGTRAIIQQCYYNEPSLPLRITIPSPAHSILNMAIISTLISYFAPVLYVVQLLNHNVHQTHCRNLPVSYSHHSHHTRIKFSPSIEPAPPLASPSISRLSCSPHRF